MDCRHVQFQYAEALSESDLAQLMELFQAAAFWARDRCPEDLGRAIAPPHQTSDQDSTATF